MAGEESGSSILVQPRSGTVGPQTDNGIYLQGGAHQYEVIDYLGMGNRNFWSKYLEPIGDESGLILK